MAEFKGTKGEWVVMYSRLIGGHQISQINIGQKDGFKTICTAYDIDIHPNKLEYKDYDTGLANAKLIAAAPDLLEALQDWCTGFEWQMENNKHLLDKSDYEMYDKAIKAIEKALK